MTIKRRLVSLVDSIVGQGSIEAEYSQTGGHGLPTLPDLVSPAAQAAAPLCTEAWLCHIVLPVHNRKIRQNDERMQITDPGFRDAFNVRRRARRACF